MNANQKLITAMRTALFRARRSEASANARDKAAVTEANRIAEMMADDLRQEGIDPLSDFGRLCIQARLAIVEQQRKAPEIDSGMDAFDKKTGLGEW
ncbi:MAG TPA: hypothetical protein VGR71_05680 [Nitrospira sp.]|nr:hypothetical protein [Nitrospira sp.]